MILCNECADRKPSYLKKEEKNVPCAVSNLPSTSMENGRCLAAQKKLGSGPWTAVYACKDNDDRLAIYGTGDDTTDLYYPKICPECGIKLDAKSHGI